MSFREIGTKIRQKFWAVLIIGAVALASIPFADAIGITQSNQNGQNLLTYSQVFDNAAWSSSQNTTRTITTDTKDPLGGSTAYKMTDSLDGSPLVHTALQPVTTIGTTYTLSVFAKAGTKSWINITAATGFLTSAYFNLSTGTVGSISGSLATSKIESVGNGWYRCSMTIVIVNPGATQLRVYMTTADLTASYQGDGTGTVYLWGAQVVKGRSVGAYNRTLGSTIGSTYVPKGATQSSQKGQNLFTYSEQFDNAAWVGSNITVTANATAAPNGTNTADKISVTAGGVGTIFYQAKSGSWDSHGITYSVYVKKGTSATLGNSFAIYNANTSITVLAFSVNYDTLAITYSVGSSGANVANIGNGWLRVSGTILTGYSSGDTIRGYVGWTGGLWTAGDYIYAWGGQLEKSKHAGAYNRSVASAIGSSYTPVGVTNSSQKGQNLLTYSEQFDNAVWTKSATTISANTTDTKDPIGTNTADKLMDTVTDTIHQMYILPSTTGPKTYSVYAKAGTITYIKLADNGGTDYAIFNIGTGVLGATLGTGTVSRIRSVGNGWYRCEIYNPTLKAELMNIVLSSNGSNFAGYAGSGAGVYLWGAQLERASKAGTYNRTTNTAINTSYVGN